MFRNWQHLQDINGALEIVNAMWLIDSCLSFTCVQEQLYPVTLPFKPEKIIKPVLIIEKTIDRPQSNIVPPIAKVSTTSQIIVSLELLSIEDTRLFSGFMILLLRTWPVAEVRDCHFVPIDGTSKFYRNHHRICGSKLKPLEAGTAKSTQMTLAFWMRTK